MVTVWTVIGGLAGLVTVLAVVFYAGRFLERGQNRGEELGTVQDTVEEIQEEMATEADVKRVRGEVENVKEAIVTLHDEHEALRELYVNTPDTARTKSRPAGDDHSVPDGSGSPVDVDRGKWRSESDEDAE